MGSRIQSGRKYFSLRVTNGAMAAVIPKGTPISADVVNWSLADLNDYLRFEGFRMELDEPKFLAFRKAIRKNLAGFSDDFPVLEAEMPVEPLLGKLVWLAKPGAPHDLVVRDIPFLRAVPPSPAVEGKDVYGRGLLPKNRETPQRIHLQPDPEIIAIDDEHYVATQSGQVRIEGQKIRFSPTYTVTEIGSPEFTKIEFPCKVLVKGDLEGTRHWIVRGDLEVEGHWSSSDITVYGNVRGRSGVHTNMQGVIRVYGNVDLPFVQMTRMGVTGNLRVESAILQSEIRVGGELRMRGSPGAVMGSTVHVFGNLLANRAGSDKGRRTIIRIHEDPDDIPRVSRIAQLAQGTMMHVGSRQWTVKEDGFFSTDT